MKVWEAKEASEPQKDDRKIKRKYLNNVVITYVQE